jgi:acetyl-CoA carboxylase carboxyltransferase component
MGGQQAAGTLLDVQVKALERQGKSLDAGELAALRDRVRGSYEEQTDVRYAAARGWVDAIVAPADTRDTLVRMLEVVTRTVDADPLRLGVFQV